MQSLVTMQQRQPDRQGTIGFGHTEIALPRWESVRTVLCKTTSSPSNRRRADEADESRSRRAADTCFGEIFQAGSGNGTRIHWKINWKSAGVRVLVWYRPETVIFAQAFPLLIDFVHPPQSFSFTTQLLTGEAFLPHRNWTSWIKEK
jgi:hypothetical protein